MGALPLPVNASAGKRCQKAAFSKFLFKGCIFKDAEGELTPKHRWAPGVLSTHMLAVDFHTSHFFKMGEVPTIPLP